MKKNLKKACLMALLNNNSKISELDYFLNENEKIKRTPKNKANIIAKIAKETNISIDEATKAINGFNMIVEGTKNERKNKSDRKRNRSERWK